MVPRARSRTGDPPPLVRSLVDGVRVWTVTRTAAGNVLTEAVCGHTYFFFFPLSRTGEEQGRWIYVYPVEKLPIHSTESEVPSAFPLEMRGRGIPTPANICKLNRKAQGCTVTFRLHRGER